MVWPQSNVRPNLSQLRQYDRREGAHVQAQKKLKKCRPRRRANDPVTSTAVDERADALLSVAPRIEYCVPGRFVFQARLIVTMTSQETQSAIGRLLRINPCETRWDCELPSVRWSCAAAHGRSRRSPGYCGSAGCRAWVFPRLPRSRGRWFRAADNHCEVSAPARKPSLNVANDQLLRYRPRQAAAVSHLHQLCRRDRCKIMKNRQTMPRRKRDRTR